MGPSRVLIAKTGVKHVHAAAHSFDIGVYFEANGHGTVLFGTKVGDVLRLASPTTRSSPAWQRLRLLPCLVNPAVGDALSDLLLVDFILATKQWDIAKWNDNLYTDLPSRQVKVQVQDRKLTTTYIYFLCFLCILLGGRVMTCQETSIAVASRKIQIHVPTF
jgi:phosphoacetylglucosamine mutase